ncbi:MAG TPA: sulfatase [Chloroflexota bacterium]|nr:sulfatase [Chloroflexota bacterium]
MTSSQTRRPNILFIMSDDHAAHAISAYGSRINQTPHLDRIAQGGMRLDACLCTNSICAPSRASILTGTYSHVNGVLTLREGLDSSREDLPNVAKLLRGAGYQTAIFGKWHLGHQPENHPVGFDTWRVLPGQGKYHDPDFWEMPDAEHPEAYRKTYQGYATDLITDFSLDWLRARDRNRPYFLMLHHKAPHRPWQPDEKHAQMYEDVEVPYPETFDDDYATRSQAAKIAHMRMEHLNDTDTKGPPPPGLSPQEERKWKYQRYIRDYLKCIASIDDNVGRVLDYLDEDGSADDTVIIYTSDQGFFLGDHGWFDKRFFYEESLRMPFLIRYPREIAAGSTDEHIVLNTDFAPLFLDYAGESAPAAMHGHGTSFRSVLRGTTPADWRTSMYYRYFMHMDNAHHTTAHYGVRTDRHKLIYYYEPEPGPQEWELFDLQEDPRELKNVYGEPEYAGVTRDLERELRRLREQVGDLTNDWES